MMRQLRMMRFELSQFITVPYFAQLLVFTVASSVALQALAAGAWGADATTAWSRSGIIGAWTLCTVSAGILGMERYRGTFAHLLTGGVNPLRTILAVVASASIFGVAALPLAWACWAVCTASVGFTDFSRGDTAVRYLLGVPLLWCAGLSVTVVIAAFFVLTPNAIAYEELLLVPVFVLSGVLFTGAQAPAWVDAAGVVIPIQAPVHLLLGRTGATGADLAGIAVHTLVVSAFWLLAGWWLTRRALRAATITGTLGTI